MTNLSNFKYAVFDLDGTLFDSMWLWKQIDYDYLGKRGIEVPEDYMKCINHMSIMDTALYSIKRFGLKDEPQALIDEWLDMAKVAYEQKVGLKDYAKDYLQFLKDRGVKMSVATSLSHELALPALERNGIIGYFDGVISSSEVTRGKGFPDVYLKAISHTNYMPKECAVFEDILKGIQGAKMGGFLTVGVYDAESKNDEKEIVKSADYYIKSFKELI